MQTACLVCIALIAVFCISVTDSQFRGYGNRFHRNRMTMRRRPMYSTRGRYYGPSAGYTMDMGMGGMGGFGGIGYHDNGLDSLVRRRYRNPMMQRRHNHGVLLMFAAEELGCATVNDMNGPDFAHYQPSRCTPATACIGSSSRVKKMQIGSVCMCCPMMVNGQTIQSNIWQGRRRYHDKVNRFDPSEVGPGSDVFQNRLEMIQKMQALM